MHRLALIAALLAALTAPATAQEHAKKSLLDPSRAAIAGGVNYEWHGGDAVTPAPAFGKEFTTGIYGAWVLTEHLSAYSAAVYGVDTRQIRFTPGLHARFDLGREKLALALTYDYYAGRPPAAVPTFAHEWAAAVIYARPLTGNLILGASESYGFDNREWRTAVGIRFPLWLGKDS